MKPNPFNPLDPNNIRISMSGGERRSLSRKRTYPWYALTIAALAFVGYIEMNDFLSFPEASSAPPNYPVGSHRYMTPPGQVRPLIEPRTLEAPIEQISDPAKEVNESQELVLTHWADPEYDWEELPENIDEVKTDPNPAGPLHECILVVEEEPRPLNFHEVVKAIGYPQIAKDAGIIGRVVVRILIDKQGNYDRHQVIHSPHPILTAAVEQHLHILRFEPAMQGDKAISFWVNVPFSFTSLN